jgi:hypothetical protein
MITLQYPLPDLTRLELPSQRRVPFPPSGIVGDAFASTAFTDRDGTVYVFYQLNGALSRLYRFPRTGKPGPVGPPLRNAGEASRVAGVVLTSTCFAHGGRVLVLDLKAPTAWRPIGAGCSAALSPDHKTVAFVRSGPDGLEIWQSAVDGSGQPHRLWSISSLPELRALGIRHPVSGGDLTWGPGGIAMRIFQSNAQAIVIRRPSGQVRVIDLGQMTSDPPENVRWQPNGDLLAYVQSLTAGGAALRVFDAATAATRVLATDPRGFGQPVWSPDGRAIAIPTFRDTVIIADLSGVWLARVTSGGFPVAWTT